MGDQEPVATAKNVPLDVNEKVSEKVQLEQLGLQGDIYRLVIKILGAAIILVIIAVAILVGLDKSTIPDGLIAIGSAGVGAMAGILAPSPIANK